MVPCNNFHRRYENTTRCPSQDRVSPWLVYQNVPSDTGGELDLENVMTLADNVIGNEGFGVTVALTDRLVAKMNLFPDA